MSVSDVRLLTPADESALETFLAGHAPFTMFLRSNMRNSGLIDGPTAYHGAYAAKFVNGHITDVAGHFWTNNIIFFAPTAPVDLAQFLVAHTKRPINGLIGPWADCMAALDGLDLRAKTVDAVPHEEHLYRLALSHLKVPNALLDQSIAYRSAKNDDLETLTAWRVNYEIETIGYTPSPALEPKARDLMQLLIAEGNLWVVVVNNELVSMSGFNARLPDMVQVGGVHTPKHFRGKGYARIAVAGSLIDAKAQGVSEAILFTEERNLSAKRVYEDLGFQHIGNYGLIMLKA